MEEAVSNFQSTTFTLLAYMVAIAAFSYLLVLPFLNQLSINKQASIAISKITFILIAVVVFTSYFKV